MVLRTVVGACAGALAGGGFVLTLEGFNTYCRLQPWSTGCGDSGVFLLLPMIVFWMLVAGVLIHAGFRMARVTRGWWATALGSGLWVVVYVATLWFKTYYLDLVQGDRQLFALTAAVVTGCAAYLVAALAVGRPRTW